MKTVPASIWDSVDHDPETSIEDIFAVTRFIAHNQITLLQNGDGYFPALEAALDRAAHDIYLDTYIFKNDATGRCMAQALKRAAQRGVKTHLLMDGFGSSPLPDTMVSSLNAAGVRVMKFRPKISPWTFRRRRLRRLHRKIAVVDQTVAFVGGINIIDDLDTPEQTAPRYDYAVRVEGPLVKVIYGESRRTWQRLTRIRTSFSGDRCIPGQKPLTKAGQGIRAAFLVRNNIRHRRDIENAYLQAIAAAQAEIILANAYFLPGKKFRTALFDAAQRGVRVILLLQERTEHPLFNYAAKALYGSFLEAGIQIYEYHKGAMHAKVAVIDSHWATIGSSNLDPFSLLLSLEANIVIDDEPFAKTLTHSLEAAIADRARKVDPRTWKTQPVRQKIASWICYGLARFMTGMAGVAPDTLGDENRRGDGCIPD